MRNWLKRLEMKAILPAAAVIAAAAIGTTFAWQTWDLSVTNQLRSHETGILVEEDFNEDDPFDHKNVKFTNNGSSSVFLRVSYTDYWQKGEEILSNQHQLNGKNEDVAEKIWNLTDWTDGRDGWYYYNRILEKGETTKDILTRVKPPDPFPEEYKGAEYHLYFKAEVVQCSDGSNTLNSEEVNNDATQKMFGRSPSRVDLVNGTVSW